MGAGNALPIGVHDHLVRAVAWCGANTRPSPRGGLRVALRRRARISFPAGTDPGTARTEFIGSTVGPVDVDLSGRWVDLKAPPSLMDLAVVISAEQQEVIHIGPAAEPPRQEVMRVGPRGWRGAGGPAASAIARVERLAYPRWHDAMGTPDLERQAGGRVEMARQASPSQAMRWASSGGTSPTQWAQGNSGS